MAVVAAILSVLLFAVIADRYGDPMYRRLGLAALVCHIFISILVLPRLPYKWDISKFDSVATSLLAGDSVAASSTVTSFGSLQAILYAVFGTDPTAVAVVNGLFAVLAVIPVLYLVDALYDGRADSYDGVTALVLFLPLPMLFLSIPMRDSVTVFTTLSALALSTHIVKQNDLFAAAILAPLICLLYYLRPEWAFVLLLALAATICVRMLRAAGRSVSIPMVVYGAIVGAFLGLWLLAKFMFSFESINAEMAYRAGGGAVYLEGMQYQSWLDVIVSLPVRALYFQFAPFPLHIESIFHLLGFSSSMTIIMLTIAAVRSIWEIETDQTVLIVLLTTYLAGIAGYGLINSNFGTNVRHRIPFVYLLVVASAPVIQRWKISLCQWFSIRPDNSCENKEQNHETQEFDGHV